jgi:hypothetical protein
MADQRAGHTRIVLTVVAGLAVCFVLAVTPSLASARSCGGTYWRSLRDGDQRCPRTHSVLSDWTWSNLRWSKWNAGAATGNGTAVHHSGYQVDERDPIQILLYRPKVCGDGTRIWTRISVVWHYPSPPGTQHYTWSYYCQPRDTTSVGAGGG